MSHRRPLPDDLGPEFAVGAGRAAGLSRGRMRAGDLDALFRGSRSAHLEPVDTAGLPAAEHFEAMHALFVARCRAYLPVAPADFRFGYVTAARLYRIPLPYRLESRTMLDAVVAESQTPPRMKSVAGHRMRHLPPLELLDGLPVLPPELAWLSLARTLTADELVIAGDHLVRRKRPQSSLERLAGAVARHGGKPGAARAREALELIRPGTDSPKESQMRLVLVRAGLPEPVIGYTVYDANGHWVGTPDLAYVSRRVALDYEGDVHRTDERTFRGDIERREMFADADWRYIRVTNDHLRAPQRLVARVTPLL
jgi:hypothetical protein